MFTVKHHHTYGGYHHVYACTNYMIVPPNTPSPVGEPNINPEILLFDKTIPVDRENEIQSQTGVKLEAHKGSVIYIENAEGHTVDVLRPSTIAK